MTLVGLFLCALSVLVAVFPRALAFPAAAVGLWGGLALLWKAFQLRRRAKQAPAPLPSKEDKTVTVLRDETPNTTRELS
jgi:hypothetical protein